MTSFVYPRTVDIHRSETVAGGSPNIGLVGYSGMAQGAGTGTMGETVIATGIPCTIQAKGMGRVKGQGLLPADAPGPGQWAIYMPENAITKGTIKDRDILVDDEGVRYQISMAAWAPLGYQLIGIRLEA